MSLLRVLNKGPFIKVGDSPLNYVFSTMHRAFQVVLVVKNSLANGGDVRETGSISGSGEDPLEEEIATHSSIHAWRIPWTEEAGP